MQLGLSILILIFVCMTLIGVKSKYGSCNGNCTGLIKLNNTHIYISKSILKCI